MRERERRGNGIQSGRKRGKKFIGSERWRRERGRKPWGGIDK